MRLVRPTLHGQKTEMPDLAVSAGQAIPCGHATCFEIAETQEARSWALHSFGLFAEVMLSL